MVLRLEIGVLVKCNPQYNYDTTSEVYEIEKIVNVFGYAHSRWFLVKYKGYEEPEWSRDCLLYTSPSPRDGLLSRMPSSA